MQVRPGVEILSVALAINFEKRLAYQYPDKEVIRIADKQNCPEYWTEDYSRRGDAEVSQTPAKNVAR